MSEIHNVHLIGIGGIGMSALARYFKFYGKNVSGYDKTKTVLTQELEKEGMVVYYEENLEKLPRKIHDDPASAENLIIYTPAIPAKHIEIQYFEKKGVKLHKRAQILGEISKDFPTTGIAGTHGKTTTTSLLTYICMVSGLEFVSFVGGINENFNSNLVIQGDPKFVITEADEFDRSFLQLKPESAIVTSMDADHLDIYGNAEDLSKTFVEYAESVNPNGLVLVESQIKSSMPGKCLSYSIESKADYRSDNIEFKGGRFHFDFTGPESQFTGLELSLPGYHNLENATAAIAMAIHLGATEDKIKEALKTYKGVKRRFEYIIDREDLKYIDDYAHHPEEISAVISSLRKMYPGRKITAVFQPHLFSRTKDQADGFAESLAHVDDLILLDIYPARELPMPGITSAWLLDKIALENKELCTKDQLSDMLAKKQIEILVTLGAGDIDQLVGEIKEILDHEE